MTPTDATKKEVKVSGGKRVFKSYDQTPVTISDGDEEFVEEDETTPEDPETPPTNIESNSSNNTPSDAVNTADDSHGVLWMSVLLAALAMTAGMMWKQRKNSK